MWRIKIKALKQWKQTNNHIVHTNRAMGSLKRRFDTLNRVSVSIRI